MVTRGKEVYCNICDGHMGTLEGVEFKPLPLIHQGGYLRLQVHDMHSPPVVYECDYCPRCSKRVSTLMREIKIWTGKG